MIKKPLLEGPLGRSELANFWGNGLKWVDRYHNKTQEIADQTAFDRRVSDEFFKDKWPVLGPYLDNLLGIYRFVDASTIGDKETLLSVLRAQLSKDELRILFYYGLCAVGRSDATLMVNYAIFKNMDPRSLIHALSEHDYPSRAFGK